MFVGCGGSIPFMEVFSGHFPEANFLLTGCGFPDSNAHSANENIDLEYTRKLTTLISQLLATM
jgi:di/tripeptidase